MIPLHCLWAKSNNRTRGQFECDILGFVIVLISFVYMHGIIWWGRVHLKLDVQGHGNGRSLEVDGQRAGGLDNRTIFMDVDMYHN